MVDPVAEELGIPLSHVACNRIFFQNGVYSDFDRARLINQPRGKRLEIASILQSAGLRRSVMIGDGMTDCKAESVVDSFICYCGVQRREAVMKRASLVVSSFEDLLLLYNHWRVC